MDVPITVVKQAVVLQFVPVVSFTHITMYVRAHPVHLVTVEEQHLDMLHVVVGRKIQLSVIIVTLVLLQVILVVSLDILK